jgi:hypothetical protein
LSRNPGSVFQKIILNMPPRPDFSNAYNEHQHGGIQVLPGDGLIPNPPTTGLEVVGAHGNQEKRHFSTVNPEESTMDRDTGPEMV